MMYDFGFTIEMAICWTEHLRSRSCLIEQS